MGISLFALKINVVAALAGSCDEIRDSYLFFAMNSRIHRGDGQAVAVAVAVAVRGRRGGRHNGNVAEGAQVNEAVMGQPAEPLRPFIAHYNGYRQAGIGPAEHRGLPSPYLTLIFTLDEPLIIAEHPDPRQPADDYVTLVGGLHTTPALVTHDGSQSGIQLGLRPLGARAILGVPAGELAILDFDGADVLGKFAAEVQERIRAAGTWPDRFKVLDELLCERLQRLGIGGGRGALRGGGEALGGGEPGGGVRGGRFGISPEVEFSWRRLLATGGNLPISALVTETGWSDRHLRNAFGKEIGLTPKAAARVIRFHRARLTLQRRAGAGRRLDLAELAADCGYYDQAHLDLEFRSLAGSAPTAWLAREFRNFQAAADVPAEGLLL